MTDDLPKPRLDLRHLDADVRKERVKLGASAFNAMGLALLIGSIVAPIVDPSRDLSPLRAGLGLAFGILCILAAVFMLRYMKAKEFRDG